MNATLEHNGKRVIFCDCDPKDCIEGWSLAGNWYEIDVLRMLENLKVGGNYLDVGAYIGTFSLFASMFCPVDEIYAIEPQLDIYTKLTRNLLANGISFCKTYNLALSDHQGRGKMGPSDGNRGGSILQPGTEVEVVTLDSLQIPNVKVAKIDVESSELAVLRGGQQTLASVEHLIVETWTEATCTSYGIPYTGRQVADLLLTMGFKYQCETSNDNHYWKR